MFVKIMSYKVITKQNINETLVYRTYKLLYKRVSITSDTFHNKIEAF